MKFSSIDRKSLIASLKYMGTLPLALMCRKRMNNVWIISERPMQARDNGFCFFKYMREEHPESPVYYLIEKKSDDYKKIEKYGNVIQFNSLRHYFYYCLSHVHISAHVNGCCPDGAIGISRRTKEKLGFKDVFLPHGVSYGISEFCLKKYAKINLFICSGKAEYDNVLANYGYSKDEVAYTGFPRLDEWHDITVNQKQIVLMPTWRAYLAQDKNVTFEKTQYFQAYKNLLQDEQLCNFLEDNELKFVFYLHNEMRKYIEYFKTECKNIEIVYRDETYDIQELLKSSALLITDYSSVHFDFAYMNKPVIYYQFDQDEFYRKQYQNSGFYAEKDGFGPVAYDIKELIQYLKDVYNNQFNMSTFYYKRMRDFYQIYDDKNCARVYEAICEKFDGK